MMSFAIRPYNPETDYPAVSSNLQQAGLFDIDRDNEETVRKYADDVLVAELGQQVVGSVYVVDHIVPTMFRLVVEESQRGQGIGTALVEAGLEKLKQSGASDGELFFGASDRQLASFYEHLGFKDGGLYRSMWRYTDPDHHDDSNVGATTIEEVLSLTPDEIFILKKLQASGTEGIRRNDITDAGFRTELDRHDRYYAYAVAMRGLRTKVEGADRLLPFCIEIDDTSTRRYRYIPIE